MSFQAEQKNYFRALTSFAKTLLTSDEALSIGLSSESSDFVRFNQHLVRQVTHVHQIQLELVFQKNKRSCAKTMMASGNFQIDRDKIKELIEISKAETKILEEDPFFSSHEDHGTSENDFTGNLLSAENLIQTVSTSAKDLDLAGLYAAGPLVRATWNSAGTLHWFSTENFFFDYSAYTVNANNENKAVKLGLSDLTWNEQEFQTQLQTARQQVQVLKRKNASVPKGSYRTYLAADAVVEILGTVSAWGTLGYSSYKKGSSPFGKLLSENSKETLSSKFSMSENFKLGINTQFNSQGELAPDSLKIIEHGKLKNFLTSKRTAKEYGVAGNGAEFSSWGGEYSRSLEISSGKLAETEILKELGTGLYINNLHYINWSDQPAGRLTGMTRYACFWVEGGEVVGPIQDLRFDDSIFRIFGSELIELTEHSKISPNTSTYGSRGLGGTKTPGILLNDFRFTL